MTGLSRARLLMLQRVLLCLLALHFVGRTLPSAWMTLNTDFPNYYLAARLAREHTDTSRIYEWQWIQREKDHRAVDQRIVGLVPITPFSTLVMWPVTPLSELSAKHAWIAFNLVLLAAILIMLPRVSGLSPFQTAVLVLMSYPLRFNLILGQYYILLLAILLGACLAAQHGRNRIAGSLIGCATAMKIFPFIFIFYFLCKRMWTAVLSCCLTIIVATAISISVFGTQMHYVYLTQVLPATLRGEGLPPFNLASNSLSTVLHRLFLYEPQWNPHPAVNAPWLFPVLHPLLQIIVFAPIVLSIDANRTSPSRTALEWSGLLAVSLVLSTSPGSYLFTLLLLPAAVLCKHLSDRERYTSLAVLIAAFFAAGYPGWHIHPLDGWGTLLGIPRLYALTAIWLVIAIEMTREHEQRWSTVQAVWIMSLAAITTISIIAGLCHQQHLFNDYPYRLPTPSDLLMASHPIAMADHHIAYIGLSLTGYNALAIDPLHFLQHADQLSLTASTGQLWAEDVTSQSQVHSTDPASRSIPNAESPAISPDGQTIAFLREVNGNRQLFVRSLTPSNTSEYQLTQPPFNIYEATFLQTNGLIVAAARNGSSPSLYRLTLDGDISPLNTGASRYPSASPDGHWLAYSRLISGNWNLHILNLLTGESSPLSHVPCNQIEPSWESDSSTLLYASDCGRALWFTSIERRRVIPALSFSPSREQ